MNKNNRFFRFSLLAFFALSLCTHKNLFGMEQEHLEETIVQEQELTEIASIENSLDPSIIAINVFINSCKVDWLPKEYHPPSGFKEQLIFILQSRKILSFDKYEELSHRMLQILTKAHELHNQDFISFYHTRPADWDFFAHIVKVCEEKKQNEAFSPEANFFLYDPEASKKFKSINSISHIIDSDPEIRACVISANLFITSLDQGESALRILAESLTHHSIDKSFCLLNLANPKNDFERLLERYGIHDKAEQLANLYKKTFNYTTQILYHIAIHKSELDRLVKLTRPFACFLEYCLDKLTSDIVNQIDSPEEYKNLCNSFFEADQCRLLGVQARILIDYEAFTNPKKIKTYGHWIGFDQETQDNYWKELRAICNN